MTKPKSNDYNEFTPGEILSLKNRVRRLINGLPTHESGGLEIAFGIEWEKEVERLLGDENAKQKFNVIAHGRRRTDPQWMQFVAALYIAETAHGGQTQKASNRPYIDHPRYVATQFDFPDDKQVAILHDAMEKSNITAMDLREMGFEEDVVADLELLTHGKDSYLDYIMQVGTSLRAGRVKIEDMKHNMQPGRTIPHKDGRSERSMFKRECYEIALPYLQAIQNKKIAPGTSIIDYLAEEPYEFLIEGREAGQWSAEEIRDKAEQLWVTRSVLLHMSDVSKRDGNGINVLDKWDRTIRQLVAEGRLPPPQRPREVLPGWDQGSRKPALPVPMIANDEDGPLQGAATGPG